MRKSLIHSTPIAAASPPPGQDHWFNLDAIANVEISSEDPRFPIEHALGGPSSDGWRAAATGPQLIRLNFNLPTAIRRIHVDFSEPTAERSQELSIYARGGHGELREVLRQQFTFSSGGASEEIEEYTVDLSDITTLELRIEPDRAHDPAHSQHYAVLKSLRLA